MKIKKLVMLYSGLDKNRGVVEAFCTKDKTHKSSFTLWTPLYERKKDVPVCLIYSLGLCKRKGSDGVSLFGSVHHLPLSESSSFLVDAKMSWGLCDGVYLFGSVLHFLLSWSMLSWVGIFAMIGTVPMPSSSPSNKTNSKIFDRRERPFALHFEQIDQTLKSQDSFISGKDLERG